MKEEVFCSYDPQWVEKYDNESRDIRTVLGDVVLDIQHIGSTSIPGLSAKPIIDMAVLVDSIEDDSQYVEKLSNIGYEHMPNLSSVERIFFRKGNPVEYHLSVACPLHTFWDRNIKFRDYLRAHPDATKEYENLKRNNLAETPESDFADLSLSNTYNQGKGEFVQNILRLAK